MRMSCNGCRVLRKGCSENCSIRLCLQWIKSPDAQAHATVFLAKFYGRAGLLNLINSGPIHLRPAIFQSLLYEACGRIVSPIYGSVGLLWSGSWPMVQAAVDAVLNGAPIVSVPSDGAGAAGPGPGPGPQQSYDIRHVFKSGMDHADLHKVSKTTRTRFKRTAKSSKVVFAPVTEFEHDHDHERSFYSSEHRRRTSVDTHDATSHMSHCEPTPAVEREDRASLDLTLGLGLEPVESDAVRVSCEPSKSNQYCESSTGACKFNLLLQLCALEQQTFSTD